MNIRRILVIVSLLAWGATAPAALADEPLPRVVVIEEVTASDDQKPKRIKRFGNRKRIRKMLAEKRDAAKPCVILVRDPLVHPEGECIKVAGNRDKIARRVDATAKKDLSRRVVFLKDEVGRPDIVTMKRFGNKNRIAEIQRERAESDESR